jgi:hypothetical protein
MHSEADVRGTLTRALRANNVMAQPIESGTTGLGISDLFVRTTKVSAWVELKFMRYEPRLPHVVTFREGQYTWLRRYYELGGTSVLGIWTPSGLHCFADQYIQEVYTQSLVICGLNMPSISGRDFIRWLDNL